MAARVVASSPPALSDAPTGPPAGADASVAPLRRSAENQPNLDELQPAEPSAEQKDFDLPKEQDVQTEGLDGDDMSELDGGKPVDTAGDPPPPEQPPHEEPPPLTPMRRSENGAVVGREGGAAPADVANLVAHPGPGRPLAKGLRNRLEPYFNTSFKDVRLHDNAADQKAAHRIGARAFTHKNHIWLGAGETENNTRLMAHELTHVVQQTKGSQAVPINREPVVRRGYFANKAESYARHFPGYTLITVLIGRTLISGKKVPMTGENLLGGLMGLIPGGTLMFDRLKEAKVIQEAFEWVRNKLAELNLTWTRIKSDISKALDTYNPWTAAKNLKKMVVNLVKDIVSFVKSIATKILEFIVKGALKLAGPYADKVWGVIEKVGSTINLILEDPLGFAKNLVAGIVGGFKQFGANILQHLKAGLLGWIFGSLESAGLQLPDKLDFKGLMSIVMQVLGLTYDNFRKQLVKKLGPNGEKKVSMIEKSVEIVTILQKEGFAGIWKKMLQMIDDFKTTLIGGMTTMVIKTIVEVGLSWLAGLSNPVGAIVKVVLSIYKLIVAFIERFEQIVEVANSIFSSIANIARGQVKQAADFIEKAIGRTVPVVLGFLAALLGLDGIPRRIRGVIQTLQKPVKKAMGKLIGFVVKKAKKLFSKLIKKLNGTRKLPSRNFKVGKTQHRIYFEKVGKNKVEVLIASRQGKTPKKRYKAQKAEDKKFKTKGAKKVSQAGMREFNEAETETAGDERAIKPGSESQNMQAALRKGDSTLTRVAGEIQASTAQVDVDPGVTSAVGEGTDTLFRAKEPRDEAFEGKYGSYSEVKEEFGQTIPNSSEKRSFFYEADHTIEKRFPKAILENLHRLQLSPKTRQKRDLPVVRSATRAERNQRIRNLQESQKPAGAGGRLAPTASVAQHQAPAQPFGKIGADVKKIAKDATQFPAIALYHRNHISKKAKHLASHEAIIQDALRADDAHAALRASLRLQLDTEMAEIKKSYAQDKGATPQMRTNVDVGLAQVDRLNIEMFGLGGTAARAMTADEASAEQNQIDKKSSSLTMEPSKMSPHDFTKMEGTGGTHSGLGSGFGDIFEKDHIIDQSFPLEVKNLPLLDRSQYTSVLPDGVTEAQLSADQSARLNELKGASLFAPDHPMKQYTFRNGYTVLLYRPVHRRVSDAENSAVTAGTLTSTVVPAGQKNAARHFKDYVAQGGDSNRQDGRRKIEKPIKDAFYAKRKSHDQAVKSTYQGELARIQDANPDNKAAAKAKMSQIVKRVQGSLNRSQQETAALFQS